MFFKARNFLVDGRGGEAGRKIFGDVIYERGLNERFDESYEKSVS